MTEPIEPDPLKYRYELSALRRASTPTRNATNRRQIAAAPCTLGSDRTALAAMPSLGGFGEHRREQGHRPALVQRRCEPRRYGITRCDMCRLPSRVRDGKGRSRAGPSGITGLKDLITSLRGAFPDLTATVDEQVAEGDKVVSRVTMTGTHEGEFMGMPATGKSFTIPGVSIWEVRGGQLISEWVNWDSMGMMQQLGVIPAPATQS